MDKLPDRLSIAQVVELLKSHGIKRSKEAVRKRIKVGELPAEMIGNQWVIEKSHVRRYLEGLKGRQHDKGS